MIQQRDVSLALLSLPPLLLLLFLFLRFSLKGQVVKNDQVTIKASVHDVDRRAEAAAQAKASAKQKTQYLVVLSSVCLFHHFIIFDLK